MKTIHKYPLQATSAQFVEMPAGAESIHVANQHGRPCLWAIVDPSAPQVAHEVFIAGTGHELPAWAGRETHVGTFFTDEAGSYVFHAFVRLA